MDLGTPQGFIGIDIADSRHDLLVQECSLYLDIALEVIVDGGLLIKEWVKWIRCDVLGRCGDVIGGLFYR